MHSSFRLVVLATLSAAVSAVPAFGQLANLKVVTDASPDYSDMESMVRSITSNWKTDAEKMYALFWWDHLARRQTAPMMMHGIELTDPIRQYNDYGFTMCSTISGIKISEWTYMGYPCRLFDISLHTVPDVWYDGGFHHYDNSLSCMYTLLDGKTIASIEDIGQTLAGPASDGKPVKGYIGRYLCLNQTSPDGFLEGADTERSTEHMGDYCFNPNGLKYRFYFYGHDRAHRYILNLRENEVYTRFYSRQDINTPGVKEFESKRGTWKADPAYFVTNGGGEPGTKDPEMANPRYHIRGNGERTFTPALDEAHVGGAAQSLANIKVLSPGLQAGDAGKAGVAVFKVEGANVITSLKIHALAQAASAEDAVSIAVSTTNGMQWQEVWKSDKAGENPADLKLIGEVSGAYEVLVRVTLQPKGDAAGAQLKSIAFDTITEVNGKTQPQLKLGKNTVYVGNGDASESIVVWPELQGDKYKPFVVEENNVACSGDAKGWKPSMHLMEPGQGYVVFKVAAPADVTSITYGARIGARVPGSHVDFLHSFDGGRTWKKDYSHTDTKAPWDAIHYERVSEIPAGTREVLFKYLIATKGTEGDASCGLYGVHMEVNHKLAAPSTGPVEVTFNWSERQEDYSKVKRSHTQVVEKLPATYTINVGGFDQPVVESLTVNLKGARPDVKAGYSDGKDVGGEKWVGKWATYGKNLAAGKPYTVSVPSDTQHGAGDPDGKKLTDGRVGSPYTGGTNYKHGVLWKGNSKPEIVVDLGEVQKCAAFRIHTLGYPFWDAMKGENKDKIEVLISSDGEQYTSVGTFNTKLRWKDVPVNFMFADDETFTGVNFFLPMEKPVEARYVKYKIDPARMMGCTEVQVLDGYSFVPFDLKLALPEMSENGKMPPKPDVSPNARKWSEGEALPTTIGKVLKKAPAPGAEPPEEQKPAEEKAPAKQAVEQQPATE